MSERRPASPEAAAVEAAALRETGATPLRLGDPAEVGPFVPLALLGSGGMGRVYLARPLDDSPGLAAVKVIRPEYAEDVRFRRRFEREAAVHARLRTPHTPRLRGTGFRDELLWMATEYVPGPDLADVVREHGALAPATVWRLTAELGRALADLAAAGIVHRDLKPSNVLLSVHGTHVIDFGISKAVDASSITGTGNRVGTPAYMSPEHLRTGRSDTASDVFSLAGTLVYAAAGHAPFGDGTGVDVMHRVAFEEPDPKLIGAIAAADPALGALLTACLAKEPEQRPTPQQLVEAATAHTGAPDWPEPLAGRVLARQRAYETLHRLAAERRTRLNRPTPPPGPTAAATAAAAAAAAAVPMVTPAGPTAVPEDTSRPQTPVAPAPAPTPAPAPAPAPAPRLRPAGPRAWTRRKPVLATAVGVTLCVVATGAFVLARQDASPTAHRPGAGLPVASRSADSSEDVVDDASSSPQAAPSPGASAESAARRNTGGPVDPGATPPSGSAPADADPRTEPPADRSSASAEPSGSAAPSPSSTAPGPATPPWISDCTHYAGKKRTSRGDTGKRVAQVQCMLIRRGYDVGGDGADGVFGPDTENAVRGFQGARGLEADGIVGRETWSALRDTV
ncbi:protein kinase [Streptomyces sp. NPDC006172]|uniref:protein kinase domain-containing protein n=1 Tax=Streptomyces sp. NPDC006172 TaxID=3154470 RepID=UPI0033F5AFE2